MMIPLPVPPSSFPFTPNSIPLAVFSVASRLEEGSLNLLPGCCTYLCSPFLPTFHCQVEPTSKFQVPTSLLDSPTSPHTHPHSLLVLVSYLWVPFPDTHSSLLREALLSVYAIFSESEERGWGVIQILENGIIWDLERRRDGSWSEQRRNRLWTRFNRVRTHYQDVNRKVAKRCQRPKDEDERFDSASWFQSANSQGTRNRNLMKVKPCQWSKTEPRTRFLENRGKT